MLISISEILRSSKYHSIQVFGYKLVAIKKKQRKSKGFE